MNNSETHPIQTQSALQNQFTLLLRHPVMAVTQNMKTPRPILLGIIFVTLSLVLTAFLLPTIMSGTQDALQASSLSEHLSPEEYTAMTQLTPIRKVFAATLFTFFSFWSVVFQAFLLYLFFTLAKYPGLYREYFTACLVVSFYDTLLPMFLSLIVPVFPFSSLNLTFLFPSLSTLSAAFLQPIDFFSVLSLLFLGFGINRFIEKPQKRTWNVLISYLVIRTLFFGSINLFFS